MVVHAPQEDGQLAQLALALMGSRYVALKPVLMSCVQRALASVRRLAPPKRVRLTQPLGQGRGRRRREILRDALAQRELARRLLGKKQLVKRALRKGALRREMLSAAPVEAAKTRARRVVLRDVALKLAQARDIADRAVVGKLVMLRAALRGGRLLAQAKPVMLSAAPVEAAKTRARRVVLRATLAKDTLARRAAVRAALANPALVRAAVDRVAAPKLITLHAPTPLALPGALGLVGSSKIRVNRRKATPVNAALMRLVRVPHARNRRHPNGVVHPLIAPRSRRASQWTRHLKPP